MSIKIIIKIITIMEGIYLTLWINLLFNSKITNNNNNNSKINNNNNKTIIRLISNKCIIKLMSNSNNNNKIKINMHF